MDRVGLELLYQDLLADARASQDSARTARERIEQHFPGESEACGYQLNRVYNVSDRGLDRINEAFKNHFENRADYQKKSFQRMTLSLPGTRHPFMPEETVDSLRELKRFRHVSRHAYDLNVIEQRLETQVRHAEQSTGDRFQ